MQEPNTGRIHRMVLIMITFLTCLSPGLTSSIDRIDSLKALVQRPHVMDTSQVNACYDLARHYLYDSTNEAREYATRGVELAALLHFPEGRARCEHLLATSHEILGELDEALVMYEKTFRTLSDANLHQQASAILINRGIAQYFAGNQAVALKSYLRALEHARLHQLREPEARILTSIAGIYRELQQYPEAIQMYEQALPISHSLSDSLGFAQNLEYLGLAYDQTGDGTKAVTYLEQAISQYRLLDRKTEADQAELSLASAYIRLGALARAESILTGLLTDAEGHLLPHYRASCYLMLARIHFEKEDLVRSLELLEKGFLLIDNSNRNELKSHYLDLFAEIYRNQGAYQQALEYTIQRMAILDTLHHKDRIETEREMKARFDLQQKEVRLIIQEEKIRQQLRERRWFAALLLISVLLILVLAVLAISKARSNKQLREKNMIIDQSLREKDVLLKEIHHRVKNNLQVVSSLLSLQARSLKGQEALDALSRGKDRVRSMALIHQNIYQDENLMGVNSQDYIDRLSRSLLASYSLGSHQIRLKTEIEPLILDIDTVIPLGLILNELITNAIKYAFKPGEMGEISISLSRKADVLELVVADNGVGMPAGSLDSKKTMGYRLIAAFVQKLKGTYDITVDRGTRITFSFRSFQLEKAS